MKKLLKRIGILILMILFLQIVVMSLKKDHTIDYVIKVNKTNYTISEQFEMKDRLSIYTITIQQNKLSYHFQFFIDYHKQKQIIKDLIVLKEKDIQCIYPILQDQKPSYLRCYDNKQEFSYNVLTQKYPKIAQKFQKQLAEKDISLESEITIPKTYQEVTYYPDYFEGVTITLWNYRYLYYLNDTNVKKISLFDKDQYENQYSIVVNQFYLIINTDQMHEFDELYIINLTNGKKKKWKLNTSISLDCYFLGEVDGKAYLFDRDNLIQYEIDPKKETIDIIGTKDKNGKYYNGTWHEKNIYEFKKEKLIFPKTIHNNKIEKNYPNAEIYEDNQTYYFIFDNNLYVQYNNAKEAVLLLTDTPMKEIQIKDNKIYFIEQDTIYQYDEVLGKKPLLTYREIEYNFTNIYTITK